MAEKIKIFPQFYLKSTLRNKAVNTFISCFPKSFEISEIFLKDHICLNFYIRRYLKRSHSEINIISAYFADLPNQIQIEKKNS